MRNEPRNRPNILFITSDQQRGDAYGYRGRHVHTPHLDRLAHSGTAFTQAITPSVVCQPARASILTGRLPHMHGVRDNGIDLPSGEAEAGFAAALTEDGYASSFIGKGHFSSRLPYVSSGKPEDRTAPHQSDWFGPYMGFEHVELTLSGDLDALPYRAPYGQHYERWLWQQAPEYVIEEVFCRRRFPTSDPAQTWHSYVPESWHVSSWVADRTIAAIRAANRSEKPFVIWTSFPDPHHPFDAPLPWSTLHDPLDVDLPEFRVLDLECRPWWHKAALENTPTGVAPWEDNLRTQFSRMIQQSDAQLASIIANYYGMISLIDHSVGRLQSALVSEGIAEDTIVIFTSDHGDWLGDHGLLLKGPMPYEGLLTVGCLISGPGIPADRRIAAPVSTVDIAATIAELAGTSPSDQWASKSLLPLIRGAEEPETALSEWEMGPARCGVDLCLKTVRSAGAKLTLELNSGVGELYDLVEDPFESKDLYGDAAYRGLRSDLEDIIRRELPRSSRALPVVGPG